MKTELVARPTRHFNQVYDYDAILSTAESGLAVRIPSNGRSPNGMRASIDQWLRKNAPAYKLHVRFDRDAVLAWVEPR